MMYSFDALFRQLSGMAAQIQQFAATSKGIDTHYPPAIGKRIKVEEGGFIHNTAWWGVFVGWTL